MTSSHIPGLKSGENSNSKRYMHLKGHSSTVCNSQDMEEPPKCPSMDAHIKMCLV